MFIPQDCKGPCMAYIASTHVVLSLNTILPLLSLQRAAVDLTAACVSTCLTVRLCSSPLHRRAHSAQWCGAAAVKKR